MKNNKRVSIALLLLVLILTACAAPVPVTYERTAQNPVSPVPLTCQAQGEPIAYELQTGAATAEQYLASAQEIEAYIYAALLAEREEIDLAEFNIPTDRITAIFTSVMNRYPDLFFVEPGISYTYASSGCVVTLKPSYRMRGEQLKQAREECAQRLDEICAQVDTAWSDFEIALYLHDYLCLHFAYDTSYQVYDMYGFLTEGKGVCQAYTLTYIALLSHFGIKSDVAVSEQMNHIWNIVMLGGKPYHVDVTWDDPIPDGEGQALHANFLRSDAGISGTGHYSWGSEYTCSSDAYDHTFLSDVDTPFVYTSGKWFFADGEAHGIMSADFSTMSTQSVLTTEEKWMTPDGGSYYLDAFMGTGAYRGNLIYNTPGNIYAHNVQSGVTVALTADVPSGMQIFGLWVDGDAVYYSVSDAPNGKMQTLICSIVGLVDYLWGDADQNGVVDGRDVTAICRYLEGLPTVCHTGAADLDDSGAVDARDAEILRQYIVENN